MRRLLSLDILCFFIIFCPFAQFAAADVICSYPGTSSPITQSQNVVWCLCRMDVIVGCNCNSGYSGPTCSDIVCTSENNCNGRGTTSGVAPCSCSSCDIPYSGTSCQNTYCHKNFHCNGRGTSIIGNYPACTCTCSVPYGGSACQYTNCHKDYHCNGRGASIAGTIYPSCVCTCNTPQYVGNGCETRICHVDYDCQNRGVNVTGTYPNCICTCQKGYGGRNCRTMSRTLSVSLTQSVSNSPTVSATLSRSNSPKTSSVSAIVTPTQTGLRSTSTSFSISLFGSTSLSQSATPSASYSLSATIRTTFTASFTQSQSASKSTTQSGTNSQTKTISRSQSQHTPSGSITITMPHTFSVSTTFTCREYDDLDVYDTCEVLRPLPPSWKPSNATSSSIIAAATLFGKSDVNCTDVRIPYDLWRGRQGSSHTIYFVGVHPSLPLKPVLRGLAQIGGTSHIIVDDAAMDLNTIALLFASEEAVRNATMSGLLRDLRTQAPGNGSSTTATSTFHTVNATLRYLGPNTLNKYQYSMVCRQWMRCPVTMSGEMHVTLLASERLFPVPVAKAIEAGSTLVSLGSVLTVSPTAIIQLGVVTSIKEMSRCMETELDDPTDDHSYSGYTNGLVNPLSLALGGDGGRKYIRGALVTSVGYLVLLSLFSFASNFILLRIRMALRENESQAIPPLLAGYPGALVGVISLCMDGAVASGTMLAAFGYGWGDHILGAASLAFSVLYIGHIMFMTVRRFPANMVAVSARNRNDSQANCNKGGNSSMDSKLFWFRLSQLFRAPTHEWSHPADDRSSVEWIGKYQSYIEGLKIRWYTALELAVALLTCVLSALAFGNLTYCITRGVVCFLLLGGQCLVMLLLRPSVHKWRWALLSTVLALQAASAALSTANAPLQEQRIELAMDCLGAVVFLLLTIIFIADMYVLMVSSRTVIRHVCLLIWRYIKELIASLCKEAASSTNVNVTLMVIPTVEKDRVFDLEHDEDDDLGGPIVLPKDGEEDSIKAQILRDLEAFERNLELPVDKDESYY